VVLGLIGLGKMGMAMALRLLGQGIPVVGWDADPARVTILAAQGGAVAGSAGEVASAAERVISIISDDVGVRELYAGAAGLLSVPVRGKLFVEMSTVSPRTGRWLADVAGVAGAEAVEAPVMGSVPKVRDGSLLALAGGTTEAVARARGVLAPLTREVRHVGPAGAGYAAKLGANVLMVGYLEAITEALALAGAHGIDVEDMLAILGQSPVASPWLAGKAAILAGGEGEVTLDLWSARKDMLAALGAGAEAGLTMPATAAVAGALGASAALGGGAMDLAAHAALFRGAMRQRPRAETKA
jgi:3-hydroxyisobutyrate dehydrogenase-like beta-hydroxyacid dehydrogenase